MGHSLMLEGTILAGPDLEPFPGYVAVESGLIEEVAETRRSGQPHNIILPGLINCHTHIADWIFKDQGIGLSLGDLVRSPDGLKHILLGRANRAELVKGMAMAEKEMMRCGITSFLDFREQGVDGIKAFRQAVTTIGGLAYGRPVGPRDLLVEETSEIAKRADGIGLDTVGTYSDLELEAIKKGAGGKPVAVHALEASWKPGEIDRALDILSANMLVHITHARRDEIVRIGDECRAAVICPRSNAFMGIGTPPTDMLLEEGVVVGLGTDNCMICSPNLFREMEFALSAMRRKRPLSVLRMATIGGAEACGISQATGSLEKGKAADILVIEEGENLSNAADIHAAIVKRAGPENILLVLRKGRPIMDRRRADDRH